MSKEKTVVITSAVRTAIGSLGGTLKNVPAFKLGSAVISSAIKKSNLKASEVSEVIMGQVLNLGQDKILRDNRHGLRYSKRNAILGS